MPDVAGHHTYLEPPGQGASGCNPLAQSLQRHQLKFSDTIAFPVYQRFQLAAFYLELASRVVVARFAKSRKLFEPVH